MDACKTHKVRQAFTFSMLPIQDAMEDYANQKLRLHGITEFDKKYFNRLEEQLINNKEEFNAPDVVPVINPDEKLIDCITNLMGILDTPIGKLHNPGEFCDEARAIARKILDEYHNIDLTIQQ